MIKQQPLFPTNIGQLSISDSLNLQPFSFKQRINQLKAKMKPSFLHAQLPMNLQSDKQNLINLNAHSQLNKTCKEIKVVFSVCGEKMRGVAVSNGGAQMQENGNTGEIVGDHLRMHNQLEVIKHRVYSEKKHPQNIAEQQTYRHQPINQIRQQTQTVFEIEDILISTYKSPNKTDRSNASVLTTKQKTYKGSNKLKDLIKAIKKSQHNQKQKQKQKQKKQKNIEKDKQSLSISIDVRQCSSRSKTELGIVTGRQNYNKQKSKHLKTQSTGYFIK